MTTPTSTDPVEFDDTKVEVEPHRIGQPWVAETLGRSPLRWAIVTFAGLALAWMAFTYPGGVTGNTTAGAATSLAWAAFFFAAMFIFVADAKLRIIPNRIMLPLTAVVVALLAFDLTFGDLAVRGALTALGAGALVGGYAFVIWFIAPERGYGWGDVKLSALAGLLLGTHSIWLALMAVAIIPPVVAVAFVVAASIKRPVTSVPFGPFIIIGVAVATFAQSHVAAMSPLL